MIRSPQEFQIVPNHGRYKETLETVRNKRSICAAGAGLGTTSDRLEARPDAASEGAVNVSDGSTSIFDFHVSFSVPLRWDLLSIRRRVLSFLALDRCKQSLNP